MERTRLDAIEALFCDALDQPAGERLTWLAAACPDESLRAEVARLLGGHAAATGYFERLAADVAGSSAREVEQAGPGRRIGPYRTIDVLGRGGMGTVYRAERADGQFDQQVALKVVRVDAEAPRTYARFAAERQIVARLNHPHIARLLDGGVTDQGQPYFVLELVDGLPLTRHCDARRLSIPARLQLFLDVADAVQYAHRHLVVHRDVKPGNVLVTGDGQVKLVDFGIAKLVDEPRAPDAVTRTQDRVLTPTHAAPEQVRGEPVTTATDVYGLGVLLFELLTGRLPHDPEGVGPGEFERRVIEEPAPRPSQTPLDESAARLRGDLTAARLRRLLAGDLDTICENALRKEADRRYQTAEQMAADVRRYLDGLPIATRGDSVTYRARKFIGRHRAGVAMAAALFVLTAGFVVVLATQSIRLAAERDKAEQVAALLVDLFAVADPSESRGASVTAREVLDRGVARIESALADQPDVRASLLDVVARVYRNLGLYERATPLMRSALDAQRETLGEVHPQVAATMGELGELLRLRGEFAAAEAVLREALALESRVARAATPAAARTRNHLGKVLIARGALDEAEAMLNAARAAAMSALGAEHEEVAESLNNLAAIRFIRGDDDAAEALFREALAIRRERLGRDHPSVPAVLNNLGSVLSRKGDHAAAETAYAEALAVYEDVFGGEHPHVATAMNNLALSHFARQELDAAEPLLRDSLSMRRRLLAGSHPDIAQSASNLALLLQASGLLDEAEALFREALEVRQQAVGSAHPLYAQSLHNLGLLRLRQGRTEEARAGLEQALVIHDATLGPAHLTTAATRHSLADALMALGEQEAALAHYEDALSTRQALLPDGHPDRVASEEAVAAARSRPSGQSFGN